MVSIAINIYECISFHRPELSDTYSAAVANRSLDTFRGRKSERMGVGGGERFEKWSR